MIFKMAAARSLNCGAPISSVCCFVDGVLANNGIKHLAARGISTTSVFMKNTPRTVGVPAWAKAAQRRRRSLIKLDKPKTVEQIEAEYRLSNETNKLDFFTTTKNSRPQFSEVENEDEKPQISLTRNKTAFVCYHPPRKDPNALLFSKEAFERPWWHLTQDEVKDFKDSLDPEEAKEVKELRQKDPKIWTVNSLSRLFKVKPLAIVKIAPLTDEQKYEIEIERKLLKQWSDYKRKEYRANQELERQRYIQETRGEAMNLALGIKA
ncbi:uncharacterized protein LOC116289500 [Actinia tenebrosa]|uniref:Uncharacterized protein LOC116289500 n=1 Tax=Actinia tenebrosa TaxID=6105 RepID=A0A6P8H7C1_ACTTE|nr:uncharacterized protein LOC116289500 [Actinia tenebrosa]